MTDEEGRDRLRRAFRRFAEAEAVPQGSAVYERLCEVVASDDALLDLAAEAAPGQPAPNLFFGSVHALLEDDPADPLAAYYRSVGGTRSVDDALGEAFRAFVLPRRDAVLALLRTHLVQTNEVRRSAVLFPVFATASAEADGAPIALIEIGASAGLNLLFDRYGYRYSERSAGHATASLVLECEARGAPLPVERVPAVVSRLGLELNALDVRSEADMRWLRALVWPEHDERRRVLQAAVDIARIDPPEVRTADLFTHLPGAITAAPARARVVVFATFVLNQFTQEMRARLKQLLLDASRERAIDVVVVGGSEWFIGERRDFGSAPVIRARLEGGQGTWRQLAVADPHGWWIDWQPSEPRAWV
ncbi:MAG: DUF2332 domain-containing protein [Dehalococcoidia bacterium]